MAKRAKLIVNGRANILSINLMRSKLRRLLLRTEIPFPLSVKHGYVFGSISKQMKNEELNSPESWDVLRTAHQHFLIPRDRDEWLAGLSELKDGQDAGLEQRARNIAQLATSRGVSRIYSVGTGGGGLEFYIKAEAPKILLTASDYNPVGVERLRGVFLECDEVCLFDIGSRDWSGMGGGDSTTLVLMYRVDPHFSDHKWRSIFDSMASSMVYNILYIPSHILNVHYLLNLKLGNLKARLRGDHPSFTGYVRSALRFEDLWQAHYNVERLILGGMTAYWLRIRQPVVARN